MGYYLRRFVGGETDRMSKEEMMEVAEQALQLQLDLALDVLALADASALPDDHKEKDRRILRAVETVRILG
jgi:hypothetical protein